MNELLGDAHVALGNYAAAEAAYATALTEAATAGVADTALLQLKINDLPAPADDEAGSSPVGDAAVEESDAAPAGTSAEDESAAADETAAAEPSNEGEEEPE